MSGGMEGSIPDCVWGLPQIGLLHVSGNAFSGSLPSDSVSIHADLTSLNIAYNKIRGTISDSLSNISFQEFDVSSNKVI